MKNPLDSPSLGGFFCTFFAMFLCLFTDAIINVIEVKLYINKSVITILALYIVQDVCIILALLVFSYALCRTNVFRAGFIGILCRRFKSTTLTTIFYLMLTMGLQIASFLVRLPVTDQLSWPVGITALFTLQRTVSVFYYYHCKRAMLRLGDPRFYDEEWVKHTLVH